MKKNLKYLFGIAILFAARSAFAQPVVVNGQPMSLPVVIAAPTTGPPNPTPTPSPPTPIPTPVPHFSTLVPNAGLPTETWCAQQVNSIPLNEVVPSNGPFNAASQIPTGSALATYHANPQPFKGDSQGIPADYINADGNFFGSTDMLIRNAACKWGIDEDVIRAEAQNESGGWLQQGAGDKQTAQSSCVQPGYPNLLIWNTTVSQPGGNSVSCLSCCYQSWGITQNKLFYEPTAFPMAVGSTAFTLDMTYAKIRSCMNGSYQTYFASSGQQPNTYSADILSGNLNRILWGCVGMHFSGAWYDAGAQTYIGEVQAILAARSWPTAAPTSTPTTVPTATPTPSTPYPIPPLVNPQTLSPSGGDDTATIRTAIASHDLHFTAGTYHVSSSINEPSGRHIQCDSGAIIQNVATRTVNNIRMFSGNNLSGNSIIGCDLEGTNTGPSYAWSTSGYDMGVNFTGVSSNVEIAGNTCGHMWGQACVEINSSVAGTGSGNNIYYNKFTQTGHYGVAMVGVTGWSVTNNSFTDANALNEQNSNSPPISTTFSNNTMKRIGDTGWHATGGPSMFLTGGQYPSGVNYSACKVSNNLVVPGSLRVTLNTSCSGCTPASYSNNVGFNG